MKSNYKKMIELLTEIEIGFTVQILESGNRIAFRSGHSNVTISGSGCQASLDFDQDGKFAELLIEE